MHEWSTEQCVSTSPALSMENRYGVGLVAVDVASDPPAKDEEGKQDEAQRMVKKPSETWRTQGKDLDIAVEEHENEAKGEGSIVGEGFGEVPVQEGVEGTLQTTPWATISRGSANQTARKWRLCRVKQSIQPHRSHEKQQPDEKISGALVRGAVGLCRRCGAGIHPRKRVRRA